MINGILSFVNIGGMDCANAFMTARETKKRLGKQKSTWQVLNREPAAQKNQTITKSR
ncbi:hypothetical protein [Pseudochelatococcus contaminans]|uniref:hypothetical protein n=1 Tax=Pseudochelatococcus contaminans TaxID=1538103 RepID=UPI00161283AD|nr:hypothetical protein [Pseudochelatococcus contaminans]